MEQAQDVLEDEMLPPPHPQPERDDDLPPLSGEATAEKTADPPGIVEGTLVESTLLSGDALPGNALRRLRPGCGRALRQGLMGAWMVLTLLLVLGLVEDRTPGLLGPLASLLPGLTSSATVTIMSDQSEQSMTMMMLAVTGTSDPTRRQVQTRLGSGSSPIQTDTAPTTGRGHTPAQQAQGVLTFYNAATYPQTIAAGTRLVGADGVQVVTDAPALLPAGNPPLFGIRTVPAHAVESGPQGNIAELDLNDLCCTSGVAVKNTSAFTGGQAARAYPVVRQQDIDAVVSSLSLTLTRQAHIALQGQIRPNEQLVNPAHCTSTVSKNHAAGNEAAQVSVSVSVTCRAIIYDEPAVQRIATTLLTQQAARALGTSYTLSGIVRTTITQVRVAETAKTLVLVVKAEGSWVYQFSETRLHHLATLVAGKSQAEGQALLLQQVGVRSISILLANGDETTFPADAHQIRIVILSLTRA